MHTPHLNTREVRPQLSLFVAPVRPHGRQPVPFHPLRKWYREAEEDLFDSSDWRTVGLGQRWHWERNLLLYRLYKLCLDLLVLLKTIMCFKNIKVWVSGETINKEKKELLKTEMLRRLERSFSTVGRRPKTPKGGRLKDNLWPATCVRSGQGWKLSPTISQGLLRLSRGA